MTKEEAMVYFKKQMDKMAIRMKRIIAEEGEVFKDRFSQTLEATNIAIKAIDQTRWIPVSERLPEQYKEVIVTDIETSDTYLSRYFGDGYWECDNGVYKNRIIAWQPKPKPYKAESDGE